MPCPPFFQLCNHPNPPICSTFGGSTSPYPTPHLRTARCCACYRLSAMPPFAAPPGFYCTQLPSIIASSFADVSVASDNNASALALAETAWSLNAEALSQEQHNFQTKFIDWSAPSHALRIELLDRQLWVASLCSAAESPQSSGGAAGPGPCMRPPPPPSFER